MSEYKCNLCGSTEARTLYKIDRFDEDFTVVKCKGCGMMSQFPQLKQDFYDEGYYQGFNSYSYVDERGDKVIREVEDRRRIENIKKFLYGNTLLDIGCSFGSLISHAEEDGIKACGIDISPHIAKYAIRNDIQISHGDACDKIEGNYSVITMIEVLEHLTDPSKALRNCYNALFSMGLLVIQTSNMDSLVRRLEGKNSRYLLPGHTHYFSIRTLKMMLDKNGFEIEKIYYGHETGFVPALIRKMLTNMQRKKRNDWWCFAYTLIAHILSKIHLRTLAVHNGAVIYARRK